jgi:hypothetical protein
MNGAIPPLPYMPSWHDDQLKKKHRDNFILPLPSTLNSSVREQGAEGNN